MVVIGTFAWSSLRIITRIPKTDAFVLILVSIVTVYTDLAIAVVIGVIVSALVFAWESAQHMHAERSINADGQVVYMVEGPLFFGSIESFNALFKIAR